MSWQQIFVLVWLVAGVLSTCHDFYKNPRLSSGAVAFWCGVSIVGVVAFGLVLHSGDFW